MACRVSIIIINIILVITLKVLNCHLNLSFMKACDRSIWVGSGGRHRSHHLCPPQEQDHHQPCIHTPVSFLYLVVYSFHRLKCNLTYKTFMKKLPRDKAPRGLMKTVNHLWRHHHDRTGEGLRSFIRALFELEWVAVNVPRNPNTERMMAQLVSVLITAMMDYQNTYGTQIF